MERSDYDFRLHSAVPEPYAEVNELREQCPILRSEQWGGHWTVFEHATVHKIAIDTDTYSSADGIPFPPIPYPPVPPAEVDPPLHKDFRMPMLDRFAPRAVATHVPFYREVVGELLDKIRADGEMDVVAQLLQPMTGYVAAELLGFPESDMEKLSYWALRILANGEDIVEIMNAVLAYFGEIYQARKAEPTDDIPSLLIRSPIGGEPMSQETFALTMSVLFTGGLDTTVSAGAHIIERLATNVEERRRLQAHRELIPSAVEEYLRYFTPLMSLRRVATRDADLEGHQVREGDTVLMHWLAANHDPAEFECPEQVRLDRKPNRHFAFGVGIHRCLGSNVARQELRVMLELMLDRIGDWELDPARPAVRYPAVVRGISELWIRFPAQTD